MLTIVEALCYLHPHMSVLTASHPAMQGVCRKSASLVKSRNGVFAPLLIDDIKRSCSAGFASQTAEDLISLTGKSYSQLPWLAADVLESALAAEHGEGCKVLDAHYHSMVISTFSSISDWRWIVVHPAEFRDQQAGMLMMLWSIIASKINLSAVASQSRESLDLVRSCFRDSLFAKFEHHWIGQDGRPESVTRPVYRSKQVVHVNV